MAIIKDINIDDIQEYIESKNIHSAEIDPSTTKYNKLSFKNININIEDYCIIKKEEKYNSDLTFSFPREQKKVIKKVGHYVHYLRFSIAEPMQKHVSNKIEFDKKNGKEFFKTIFAALPNIQYLRIADSVPSNLGELIEKVLTNWHGERNVASLNNQMHRAFELLTKQN
ncbi:MAG: hypothetical protein ACK5O7_03255 [Holosporales bacterium]